MDLRSVLNTSDNGDRAPSKPPPAPPPPHHHQHLQHQQQQQQPRPASATQYGPGPREYSQQPPQASPSKPAMHDYSHPHQQPQPHPHPHHYPPQQVQQQQPQFQQQQQSQPPQHRPSNAYPAQSPYQTPGPYPGRPSAVPPPPLQPPSLYHDPRSPGSSRSNSGPVLASPYRPSPTSASTPGGSAGYPFPTQPPDMSSPIQRQYPSQYQDPRDPRDPRRDSYAQSPGHAPPPPPPAYQLQHQHQQQQMMQQQQQQQHAARQSSPARPSTSASSASYQAYLQHQQRSPTVAQQHYGPYAQGSPGPAAPPPADYSRHPSSSQPPTPLGPPSSALRQPSTPGGFGQQPPSPYQQRMSPPAQTPTPQPPAPPAHVPPQAQTQPSPKPAPPPETPAHRPPSQQSAHGSPVAEPAGRPRSQTEREQSLSVSPKTRLGSIPSVSDATPALTDRPATSSLSVHSMAVDSDRAVTPAKRKLEDLNMSPGELENKGSKPPPGEVNGGYVERIQKSSSPIPPKKRRTRYTQPPIWAQSIHTLGKKLPSNPNFVLQKRLHSHINGKHDAAAASHQTSPETKRNPQPSVSQPPAPSEPDIQEILGPWEASITGLKPIEELSKNVADFFFIHAINNQDMQEIMSRGIQFEIEAKLGTLIDKDTNQRVDRFVSTECILDDNGRVAFKSSMTEAQHKSYNQFLNDMVVQTDPRNPNGSSAKRVQVIYKHRREIDRFYDLPTELHGHLPGCMRARLGSRSRNIRVRVTYDQKTNQILNKIIKARVADIDLHLPMSPFDCRISINLEMNWDGSVEELEQAPSNRSDRQPDRNKDRLSYKQGPYQIDLTQVAHPTNGPGNTQRIDREHELEIELNHQILLDQGRRALSGAPHKYQELVEGFVDNVRVLARKARDFTPR
ncbi:mRNA triphosphatase CET1 [Trichoderma citrinoviride]|uniref:mRNA-capping enzyme subunit beta n=1 Tax=Trichoderma citrinoviride TaxID=58853 RepID=A0A2T4B9C8_9HYPO|nr:mRNA triphosphatase CET1 [Trichoderma citrinoviride]PTB65821.1 mRNA triphosphatase CET1 [Trichoderma citrinoviride]